MTTAHSPLHDPERDEDQWIPPLDFALERARNVLAEQAGANIHDHRAVLTAAVTLDMALRALVAAHDTGAGQ